MALVLALAVAAAPAAAQSVTLGYRATSVREEAEAPDAATRRLRGGFVRLSASPRTALELAVDVRSTLDEERGERVREYPVQGSLLVFLARASVAPYLLGGAGWYTRRVEPIAREGPAGPGSTTRRLGTHAGIGAELLLTRRLALHADYRYTFLRVGGREDDAPLAPGAVPLPGTLRLQERLGLWHEGSMWTIGVALAF